MSWTSFTSFSFQLDNLGLSVSTWFGDIVIPSHTLALIVAIVAVLRIRKIVRDRLASRKVETLPTAPPLTDLWNTNPFDDFA